ncbi:MAG: VWA domain-containing protein, partial [Verrucomicrobiota bacterium]
MTQRNAQEIRQLAESLGPAERLLDLLINFPDHLWHNRPGIVRNGTWRYAPADVVKQYRTTGRVRGGGRFQEAGPNRDAIERVYSTLAEIWSANHELAARLASYIMRETDWRDMKVVCAAFMLVQSRCGAPVREDIDGTWVTLFNDDDYREVGEAMIKFYQRGSRRMMNPKIILRIGEVLSLPGVVEMNRVLGFGHEQKRKPFMGRYYKAVRDWLAFREANIALLEGLARSGYGSTVRSLCRMVGYKPKSQRFFEILGWRQKQHTGGHRSIGLTGLRIDKTSFAGLSEEAICRTIVRERIGWKQAMGLLPKEPGLTPAIMVAMLDRVSDKDLSILTPTLEQFGLLEHEPIRTRWDQALRNLDDQRSRNIAKNVRDRDTADRLTRSADDAVVKTVEEATRDAEVHIMFIIDISSSMQGAIDLSKEALSMIVQGFPPDKLHISCFNTVGQKLVPRHYSGAGIKHMLSAINAGGGTTYSMGVAAFNVNRVRIPAEADLVLFAVGDEAGESGDEFARNIQSYGYRPTAFAHIVNVAPGWRRGRTVRDAAEALGISYTEVNVEQFNDVYQVQRSLKAILEAQPYKTG